MCVCGEWFWGGVWCRGLRSDSCNQADEREKAERGSGFIETIEMFLSLLIEMFGTEYKHEKKNSELI